VVVLQNHSSEIWTLCESRMFPVTKVVWLISLNSEIFNRCRIPYSLKVNDKNRL
jgi:hypothetical protein